MVSTCKKRGVPLYPRVGLWNPNDVGGQMPFPHTFPSLLNTDASPSVLLIGAGMSKGIAPIASELAEDIRIRHGEVMNKLGVDPSPPPENNDLYDWAQRAFNKLRVEQHLTDDAAKLRMANAMGVTTDPRYRTNVGTILRKQWPRHRVVARFAREGRWRAIWSLNWDCVLESALECVGLKPYPHPQPGNVLPNRLPWKQWYCTWCPGDMHVPAGQPGTLYVCKPHGCVNKIAGGNPLFIVTRTDLETLTPRLQPAAEEMNVGFSHSPLVTVGWKADEDYIYNNIDLIRQRGTLIANGIDRLSIVNRTWYPVPPNKAQEKHNRLATTFGVDQNACYFSVENAGDPTTDDLFQWIQTRYALLLMLLYAQNNGVWAQEVAQLEQIAHHFEQPRPGHLLNSLFDDFLSVWVRLCFNARRVVYWQHGALVKQTLVATHLRDEHIPWGYGDTPRHDLLAAIPLVVVLWQQINAGGGNQWDFNEFPGAFWHEGEGHLILPLPAWNGNNQPIELAAMKPLMEARSWPNKGSIRRLSILPLLSLPTDAPFTDDNLTMRGSVASLMKQAKFAVPTNIEVVGLADI